MPTSFLRLEDGGKIIQHLFFLLFSGTQFPIRRRELSSRCVKYLPSFCPIFNNPGTQFPLSASRAMLTTKNGGRTSAILNRIFPVLPEVPVTVPSSSATTDRAEAGICNNRNSGHAQNSSGVRPLRRRTQNPFLYLYHCVQQWLTCTSFFRKKICIFFRRKLPFTGLFLFHRRKKAKNKLVRTHIFIEIIKKTEERKK